MHQNWLSKKMEPCWNQICCRVVKFFVAVLLEHVPPAIQTSSTTKQLVLFNNYYIFQELRFRHSGIAQNHIFLCLIILELIMVLPLFSVYYRSINKQISLESHEETNCFPMADMSIGSKIKSIFNLDE